MIAWLHSSVHFPFNSSGFSAVAVSSVWCFTFVGQCLAGLTYSYPSSFNSDLCLIVSWRDDQVPCQWPWSHPS